MSRSFLSARSSLSCCSNANRSPRGISKKMSWMSYRAARNWGTTEAHMNTRKDRPLLSVDSNCTFIPGLWLSPAGSGLVLSRWPSYAELQSGRIGWTPVCPKQTYTHTWPNMQLFHTHFFFLFFCECNLTTMVWRRCLTFSVLSSLRVRKPRMMAPIRQNALCWSAVRTCNDVGRGFEK